MSPNRRVNIHSGAPWEPVFGYSRAVRVGRNIAVSGSTSVGPDGEIVGVGDTYAQACRCIEVIADALTEAGASLKDVVRTRIFVTNIDEWEHIARAHQEAFGDSPPAASMVEVTRLIHPDMLLEIEADAIIADD